jgi:hypothetical protein
MKILRLDLLGNKLSIEVLNLPDFEKDKDLQLISEPIDFKKHSGDILTCRSCGNILDLSSDLERARAVKQFHNVKFVKVIAE